MRGDGGMAAAVGAYVDFQGLPAAGGGAGLGQAGLAVVLAGPQPVSLVRAGPAPPAAVMKPPFLPMGRHW